MHEVNIKTTVVGNNLFYAVVAPMVLNVSNEMVVGTLKSPVVSLFF
jgi:hypothetical protein